MGLKSTHMQFSPLRTQGYERHKWGCNYYSTQREKQCPIGADNENCQHLRKRSKMLIQSLQTEELMNIVSAIRTAANCVFKMTTEELIASITNKAVMVKSNEQFGDNLIDTHLIYIAVLLDLWYGAKPAWSKGHCVTLALFCSNIHVWQKCDINKAALTWSPKTGYIIQNQQNQINTRHICDWWVRIWVIYWPTIGNLQTIYIHTMVLGHTCNFTFVQCFLRVWQVPPMQQKASAGTRQACQPARAH